jgi:hypothetical protein
MIPDSGKSTLVSPPLTARASYSSLHKSEFANKIPGVRNATTGRGLVSARRRKKSLVGA